MPQAIPERVRNESVARFSWLAISVLCAALELAPRPVLGADAPQVTSGPVLTNASQVRALSPEEANRYLPVRIRGVVTYMDLAWSMLFVQDSTGGIFVMGSDLQADLPAGQEIEISGLSHPGAFSPVIYRAHAEVRRAGKLPSPVAATIPILRDGKADGGWVEIRGVVGSAMVEDKHQVLQIEQDGNWIRAILPKILPQAQNLVSARVCLQGICTVSADKERRVTGVQVFVPDEAQVVVEEPAPKDPFALPLRPIAKLLQTDSGSRLSEPVRVQGVVRTNGPGGYIRLQDRTGIVRLGIGRTNDPNELEPGLVLDVVGSLTHVEGELALQRTASRRIGFIGTNEFPAARPGSTGTNLLIEIGQIRSLGPEEADRQRPVRTRCVVTYYDMEWGILFVQGPSGGIYIGLGAPRLDLHLGDWIELEGVTAAGEYAPVIIQPRFQLLGRAPLPEARRYSLKELSSGSQDSQWLSMAGIVHSVKMEGSHVTLDVAEPGGHFEVTIPNLWNQPAPTYLVDAAIRLEGVCGTVFNQKRQLIGIRICVPSMDFIKTEESAPADPFSLPLRTVGSLLQFTTDDQSDHRVLIRGAVTLHRPGEFTYVQDDTGGIRLHGEATGPLTPGDQIEVVGFPAPGTCGPILIQAIWRKISAGRQPQAGRTTAEQILSAEPNKEVFDSRLISMRGRLLDLTTRSKQKMLVVQDGPFVFNAYVESPAPLPVAPRPGSLVELTGVCAVQVDASHSPKSFQLYLRSPADLHIILNAPWWTARHTLGIIAVMGLIILTVAAWVMALRRRVQTQTRLIKQALAQEQALEARYRELFENNPHPMWVYDQQTLAFLAVNEAAVEHYGYSREEFLRMTIKEIRPPAEVDSLMKHLESGLNPHIQHGGHWKHCKKSGEVIDVEISSHQLVFTGRLARLVLVTDITERLRSEAELYRAQKELVEVSRQAGMAEVATSVLHNVGNVLNSANVSATVLADQLRKSKAGSLSRAAAMLNEHASDLPMFLTADPKGKQLPGYFSQLAEILTQEQQAALAEIDSLRGNLEHIKDIVAMQQSYARVVGVAEVVKITDVVEDALRLNAGSLARHGIQVVRQFQELPPMNLERHKILQILVNLVRNAKYACDESGQADKRMTLSVANGGTQVKISVSDNGVGIPPENLTRIFSYGFTTRKDGHGFGLHSGALAAKEMGGELTVHSDGPGCGATFTLALPVSSNNSSVLDPNR